MRREAEPGDSRSEITDFNIEWSVEHTLGESADVDVSDLRVKVLDGIARLTGVVNTLREKDLAARIAEKLPGVRGVENDIVIDGNREPTNSKLYRAVADALADFPPDDPAAIGVRSVCDGVAYLVGNAASALEAKRAAEIASGVPGIKMVVNEISIAPGVPMGEIDIKNTVEDALTSNEKLDARDIEVCVDHTDVYLDGCVDDEDEMHIAEETAAGASGVRQVINRLHTRQGEY